MEATPAPKAAPRLDVLIPLGLFALTLLLRLVGIGWGLKNDLHWHSYHPDEAVVFAYAQQIEPAKLDFTPGFYNYGTLYLTVLKVAGDVVATYSGGYDPRKPQEVADFFSRGHMAGRVISALAGAGTVWVVFLMLRRRTNLLGAIMGSLMVGFAPGHVMHSRFQTVDILGAFFVALCLHNALKFLPPEGEDPLGDIPGLKVAALAGVWAGLAAGTKYTGILAILALAAALYLAKRPNWGRDLGAGIGASLLVFLVTTPGIFLESAKFMKDFKYEMTHTATGHGLVFEGTPSGFVYHLGNLAAGIGPILAVLALIGLGVAAWQRQRWAWVVLAFMLPYYILIGRAEVKFLRYTFPLYAGMAMGFGWLMGRSHERKGAGLAVVACGIAGLGGLDLGGLRGSALFTTWMAGEDPRDEAARYLKSAGAQRVGLASDPWYYSVPLFADSAAPRWVPFDARMQEMSGVGPPTGVFHRPTGEDAYAFDTRLLSEDRPDYVAISSMEFQDLERLKNMSGLSGIDKLQVDREQDFMRLLNQDYTLDRIFGPNGLVIHDLQYIRPVVYVWKRKATP